MPAGTVPLGGTRMGGRRSRQVRGIDSTGEPPRKRVEGPDCACGELRPEACDTGRPADRPPGWIGCEGCTAEAGSEDGGAGGAEAVNPQHLARWVAIGAALLVGLAIMRNAPHDQTVRVDLGAHAAEVEVVRVKYSRAEENKREEQREVSLAFKPGEAPRIVSHEARLANGKYAVELEIHTTKGATLRTERVVDLEASPVTLPTRDLFTP